MILVVAAQKSRRRLRPEVRRAELLEAALAVLKSHDPKTVRVEDITKAAGAAKGTFYLYFPSWNHLLAAVRDHMVSNYGAQIRERFAPLHTPAQWWTAFEEECVRFVDFIVEMGDLHKAIFHNPELEEYNPPGCSAEQIIAELLRQAFSLEACRSIDPGLAAPLLFSLLHTTADGISRFGDRKARVETLLELVHAWLQRHPYPTCCSEKGE